MAEIWSHESWAEKGPVTLYMFRKRLGAPRRGEPPRPVLFLVHGSSFSARSGFDLTVPGRDDYSMMDWLARRGYDVWGLDHEGYGRSTRRESNSDIACGVEDLRAGTAVVERETGQERSLFYGQSSGHCGRPPSPRPAPSGWSEWSWIPSSGPARTPRP